MNQRSRRTTVTQLSLESAGITLSIWCKIWKVLNANCDFKMGNKAHVTMMVHSVCRFYDLLPEHFEVLVHVLLFNTQIRMNFHIFSLSNRVAERGSAHSQLLPQDDGGLRGNAQLLALQAADVADVASWWAAVVPQPLVPVLRAFSLQKVPQRLNQGVSSEHPQLLVVQFRHVLTARVFFSGQQSQYTRSASFSCKDKSYTRRETCVWVETGDKHI